MTNNNKIFGFLVLGTSLVSLSACGIYSQSMPSGYTYHHDEYKSPAPIASSSKVTVEQRQYMDATQAEQFRSAVYDLLERLTMRAGMPPKPVYISAPDPMTTFYANLDNDLRESMRHIGYAISDTPQDAYVFTYEAQALSDVQEGAPLSNNVQVTIRVFDSYNADARQLTEEVGQYFIQGADVLQMGPANQKFLNPTGKQVFNKVVPAQKAMVAPQEPIMKVPTLSPVRAPVDVPVIQAAPVVRAPIATPAASTPVVRSQVVNVDDQPAPRQISRSSLAGKVSNDVSSSAMTSYSKARPSRSAIKVINHGDTTSTTAPAKMMKKDTIQKEALPSLEEIEAEIRKLDAEIEATTNGVSSSSTSTNKAEDIVRGRVSRAVN